MTIGERIQFHRKQKQLSQEDLAQKLVVSRQTVSLWENNQTLPTIDNLIRLKEIFDISIDNILGVETPLKESDITAPSEKYNFKYEKNKLKFLYRICNRQQIKKLIATFLVFLFSVATTGFDTTEEQNMFFIVLIAFLALCISLKNFLKGVKNTKSTIDAICINNYIYEIYTDSITVRTIECNDEIKKQKFNYSDFINCWDMPSCFVLESKTNQIFLIPKSALSQSSIILHFSRSLKTPKTDFSSTQIGILKTLGTLFFVLCFFCMFFSLIVVAMMSTSEVATAPFHFVEDMWTFYLFLPIPVISVIIGILLNKKGIPNKKNIVCGIIIGILLLIYGSFPFIFNGVTNYIESIELTLGIDMPLSEYISINHSTGIASSDPNIRIKYKTDIVLTQENADAFEKSIQNDKKWSTDSIVAFKEILPDFYRSLPDDCYLIYNSDTGQFNSLPDKDDTYRIIYITYDKDDNDMCICEYFVNYKPLKP